MPVFDGCMMNSSHGTLDTTAQDLTIPTTTDNLSHADSLEVVAIRTTILVLLLILSLVGNALVVLSVAQASKSRFNPFNAFLLSMAIYGLLECALTMSLAIGFSVERRWMFGEFLIGFNASFIQLQNVGVMLTIAFMSIDRYLATTHTSDYHSLTSVHKANYAVLYTWIHAFLFAVPLLFQSQMIGISARDFVERCLCGLQEGTTVAYTASMIILCLFIPILLVIMFLSMVASKAMKERNKLSSTNSSQYANYLLQESAVLKEARCGRYVTMLFILYLIFKMPYQTIDILTQLSVSFAYEPASNTTVDYNTEGAKFYYQTVLSWMMFCFSALYPVLTFIYFNEHWRRLRNCVLCGSATVSIANSRGNGATNLRQIRQKQRRHLKQQRRLANRSTDNSRTPKHTKHSDGNGHKKAPSSVSSNITSEKVTVNGSISQGGEGVLFRVPVLYAATDGLHLVASHKTLGGTKVEQRKRKKTGSDEVTTCSSGSVPALNQALDQTGSTKKSLEQSGKDSPGVDQQDDDLRPSSVIDKRVDVTSSRDGLNDLHDEAVYITSDMDLDDDTESELNESANSRTLIWPHHRNSSPLKSSSTATVISAASHGSNRKTVVNDTRQSQQHLDSLVSVRQSFHSDEEDGKDLDDSSSITHPHTPTPPPDEEPALFVKSTSHGVQDSDSDDTIVDKTTSRKLTVMSRRYKSVATAVTKQLRPLSQGGGDFLLRSRDAGDEGISNHGYESPSKLQSKSSETLNRDHFTNAHSNKVHPNRAAGYRSAFRSADVLPSSSLDRSVSWEQKNASDLIFIDLDKPASPLPNTPRSTNNQPSIETLNSPKQR
uniref:Histamine H2 receptor n=1 Tax=Phallusia mammillata TaxID=59560 RepID=A0A6F9DE12_9ASCI|nr:histamine H2 receptor [Phallusia mammillata]